MKLTEQQKKLIINSINNAVFRGVDSEVIATLKNNVNNDNISKENAKVIVEIIKPYCELVTSTDTAMKDIINETYTIKKD